VGAIRVCSPGSWGRSGNAIGEFRVFTQPLAGAAPAGWRKWVHALSAGMHENGRNGARAAGQLSSRPLGCRCFCFAGLLYNGSHGEGNSH